MNDSKMKLAEIAEQDAVFDGEPDFMPIGAVMNLLNYNAYGGTWADQAEARESGDMNNPIRYRVRVTVEYVEL